MTKYKLCQSLTTTQQEEVTHHEEEIVPEAEEVEVYHQKAFPTESRIKQKAKHQLHKELTGEKQQPKKRAKKSHPGHDDCGEDFTSLNAVIGESETFTIFDHLRTPEEHSELDFELDPRTELFLFAVEEILTPHMHFFWG